MSRLKMVSGANFFLYSVVCFCILFLTPIVASDQETDYWPYTPKDYPDLIKAPKLCSGARRNPPTAICDPQNILNRAEAARIDLLIERNSNGTYCFCSKCTAKTNGLNIKVAIVEIYAKHPNKTLSESAQDFVEYLRMSWNVSPVCNNDVIIFVSTVYNRVHIAKGSKADKVLSSSITSSIISDGKRMLEKYGDLTKSLEFMIDTINEHTLAYDPRLGRLGLNTQLLWIIIAAVAGLVLVVGFVYYCARQDNPDSRKRTRELNMRKQATLQRKHEQSDNCEVLIDTSGTT